MRHFWIGSGMLVFCVQMLGGGVLYAAEQGVITSQKEMVQQSIRERVQTARQQRHEKMPYLDRAFITQSINAEKVTGRQLFISHDHQGLQDVIDRAIEIHTPARASRERISLSKRRILVALRNLFPDSRFDWEQKEGHLSGRPFNNMNFRFSFRQPLFRGGILWNTLLQEKAGLEAAKKEYDAVISDLINDVSAAFFEYHRALRVDAGQAQMVEKMKRFADISQQKYDQQIISEIEHLNVQSLYSQLQYDHETSKQEVEIAKLELQKYLNIDLHEDLEITPLYTIEDLLAEETDSDESSSYPPEKGRFEMDGKVSIPELTDLIDLAYTHRPELRVESSRLQFARLEERIRWGELLPRADFVVEFGKVGEAFDDQSRDPSFKRDYSFQLEMSWNVMGNSVNYNHENTEQAPSVSQFLGGTGSLIRSNQLGVGLFDRLQSLADAKEAEVEKLEQIVELEQTEKEVILDVKQSYYDYQKASIQVKSSIQRVNYRQRLANLSRYRLEKNEIEVSEYLQAELDLLNEKAALHQALSDYFTAKAKLNHAIGQPGYFEIEEKYES